MERLQLQHVTGTGKEKWRTSDMVTGVTLVMDTTRVMSRICSYMDNAYIDINNLRSLRRMAAPDKRAQLAVVNPS